MYLLLVKVKDREYAAAFTMSTLADIGLWKFNRAASLKLETLVGVTAGRLVNGNRRNSDFHSTVDKKSILRTVRFLHI